MTKTYINIISQEEFNNRAILPNTKDRFTLDEDSGVFNHLENMFNEHVKQTDKILIGGDCLLSVADINIMLKLIENEKEKLEKIFLDSWEFQNRPEVIFKNYNQVNENINFDKTKAYLAEKQMLNSQYEIRKGQLLDYKFEIEKKWYKTSKKEINDYLSEFKSILEDAIKNNQIITSSYY